MTENPFPTDPPIPLVVPTGDASPGTPRGSIVVQPSCSRDVWAWLHTMRTGADLLSVEDVESAAEIELAAFSEAEAEGKEEK